MNKILVTLLFLLLSFGFVSGCGTTEQAVDEPAGEETEEQITGETAGETAGTEPAAETEAEEMVSFVISRNNGEEVLAEENVEIEEGDTLLNVLQENFEVKVTEEGFITSIEGVSQDEEAGLYWMYEVNQEMASVGAGQYELEAGDEVVFDLHALE